MQKERHSSRECSGGNDETETKHGEESTTSVMQMSTESGSDYHSSNEKKPFADKFCQSLAPPPVTVGNAIATEGEDSDDSDDSDEASHSHKLKTAAQLLSPREQSLRGTQNRIIPLSPPSQQQQLQQHMHNHHHDDTLERGCCCFVNSENDWNARYQQILLLPKTTDREKLRRAVELKKLYDEFDESAIRIAKELVTENGSPIKKYPPVSTNGVAGGQKFIVNGILFKFARDWKQIYGGDSNAAKAAGHELLCIRSVLQLDVPDIFTPLTTLVDYAGFRITAVSLLPIDSTTLVYGSDNGGKTVVSKSTKVARIMEDFARKLNLKAHQVNGVRLFTPGDLEAHHGFDDKDYLVDTTRLFPCQTPFHSALFIPSDETKPCKEIKLGSELFVTREKWSRVLEVNFREEEGSKNIFTRTTALGRVWSEVSGPQNQRATALVGTKVWGNAVLLRRPKAGSLYRMLRPELVRTNDVPLSSDAWTKFQSSDPAREEHNEEVNCATQRLLKHVIPAFAEHLQRHTVTPVNHNELANLMHRHGINIRFMGMVRKLLTRPHLKSFLLTDMVSRVVKEKLRGELRVWVGFKASEARRRLVVDYFNKVFGRSAAADDFWRLEVAVGVQHKFIYGLAVEEAMPGYDIRQNILMFSLFNRISEITGVRFKPGTYKRLFEHPFLFDSSAPFTYGDLEGLSASRKNASIISEDMGTLIRAAVAEEEAQTLRLLEQIGDRQALAAFEAVCQVKTHRRTETILGADSKEAVASLFDLARTHLRSGNNTMALDAAIRGLSYGEVLFGVFSEVALNGAVLLGGIYQRMGDLSRAIEYYGRALDAVQRLYKQHPLVGTLTSKLYFCSEALTRKSGAHPAHDHLLAKSYASFCEMYGRDAAALLLPLLGYEQSDPAFANVIQDLVQVKDEEKSLLENSRFLWPPGLYESLGKVATSKNTATPQEDLVLSYNSLLSPEQNSSHSVLRQNHQKPATATSSSFPSSSSSSSSSSLLFVNRCCDSQCSPLQTSPLPPLSSPLPPAANPSLVALQKQKQMCTSRSAVFSKSIEVPKMQENFSLVNEDDEKKCSGYT